MSAPPPPPPPAFNLPSASSAGGEQGRNLLLQSIRSGKTLKKTVTVDKSAPCITGKVKNGSASNFSTSTTSSSSPSSTNSAPMGLGGLFAGGMPKLKPTGLRGTIVEKDTSTPSVAPSPPPSATATMKRGPPPAPPPAAQKPQLSLTQSSLENTNEIVTKGFGKPMLAPKPPVSSGSATLQKPCPPPKKPELFGGSVSRAQSMRLPRSPPVLAPAPSSLYQSQDCLHESQQRPINRVLRPPVARPPSPPTSRISSPAPMASITRAAPPPPSRVAVTAPSMPPPPPPPPHRSNLTHQRLAPPPPPTPPTRNLSLSNGQSTINNSLDFETRFSDMFHSIGTFPQPEPFRGVPKLYNSKNAAKQQAPAPPAQSNPTPGAIIQLNSSTGGKQWPSSVC